MTADPREIDAIQAAYRAASRDDFMLFVDGLTIPSATGPQLFADCMAPFQRETFAALAESIHAVRDGTAPPTRRWWIERTKKAGKDSDLAIVLLWLVAFATRPLLIQVCAAKEGQAAIIKRRAKDLITYNPWLGDLVSIQQGRIVGGLGEVKIETTHSGKVAHGDTPDLLILNELVHVDRWGVMEAHMNNADGVPRGVVIIATNAGIKGSPAWVWRENALAHHKGRRWCVKIWHRPAPWLDDEDVAEAKRRDPIGGEFDRLYWGRWISGMGDALTEGEIDAVFRDGLGPSGPLLGWLFLAALDMGISHDHSGLVVVGVNPAEQEIVGGVAKRIVRVFWLRGFVPSVPTADGKLEVDAGAVERECLRLHEEYGVEWFGYDPAAGGWAVAQRLRERGVPMREMTFSSANLTAMAQSLVQLVKGGRLECYEDPEGRLRRDLGKFSIEHKPPSGYKLTAVSDEHGHADVGTALVICLPTAIELLGGAGGLRPDDDVGWGMEEDLTEEEVEGMDDEMRGIYDVSGPPEGWRGKRRDGIMGRREMNPY